MLHETHWIALRKLLDLAQELAELHADEGSPRRKRVRRGVLLRQLRARLSKSALRQLPVPLAGLAEKPKLDILELMLVTLLLERRLAAEDPSLSGRELLQMLGASSADLIALELVLRRNAPLLRARLVSAQGAGLDGRFRLHESVFNKLRATCTPGLRGTRARPFEDATEHLLALRELVLLHEVRAAHNFPWSCWRDVHSDVSVDREQLERDLLQLKTQILKREAKTAKASLPWLAFREAHGLQPLGDEELILAALLCHELLTALPSFGIGDLVRIVSANARDAVEKRKVLEPESTLRSALLVNVEVDSDPMDPQAPVLLARNARDSLLPAAAAGPVGPGERRRFHRYLAQLKDSSDFYRRLR